MKKNHLFKQFAVLLALCMPLWSCTEESYDLSAEEISLSQNWKIQSSAQAGEDGKLVSSAQANTEGWYGATVPSTVMGTLTKNGLYQDLLVATNYSKADKTIFDKSWWYRTEFKLSAEQLAKHTNLEFDGITYRANIWLNGELVSSKDETYGAFRRHKFDISKLLKDDNILAVEVFRAGIGEPNLGFVDWNPRPLDESMGIFREARLVIESSVGMHDTWVQSKVNLETLKEANISVQTDLENYTDATVSGKLVGIIENIRFSVPVSLNAGEKKTVKLTDKEVKEFAITNPRLWWSVNLGEPNLYDLDLKFVVDNKVSAQENITFGIRDFQSYMTESGHRGIMLNGKKVLVKSAGWTDDIFLRDTPESNEIQVQYVKDMNMNMVRFENVWGNSRNIYELCDRYGLIVFVGWSCQWEWEGYMGVPDDRYGCIHSEHDINLLADYWRDQLTWLRNHASIGVWMAGSDKIPTPELEKKYIDIMKEVDDRVYVAASQKEDSEITGATGMKMYGPYEYVGPSYWFIDKKYGGGYGFNTETGPGAQLPILESIEKMIPQDKLWPINEVWNYHCTVSTTALNDMKVNTAMVDGMYGKANNLKEYLDRSHLSSYQSTKSMFEAFRVNKGEATGIVQWMLNSAWPSMYWQLYDFYMIPVPSYYGVKRANEPLQLIYNYADNGIYAVNETIKDAKDVRAAIKAYDINSKLLYEKEIAFGVAADKVEKIGDIDNSALNTFLFLTIKDSSDKTLAENSYTLSSVADEHDWDKTNWVGTPMKSYGNFKALATMPKSELKVSVSAKNDGVVLTIENPSESIAFFSQFVAKDANGELIYPIMWDDNYISLLPGEKRELKASFDAKRIKAAIKTIKVSGWNIEEQNISLN